MIDTETQTQQLFSSHRLVNYMPLTGSEKKLLPGSRPAGTVDPDQSISVTVHVRSVAEQEKLDLYFDDLAEQPPSGRDYLSHEKMEEEFGADKEDMDAVESFANHFNLLVLERSPEKQNVVLGGKVRDFTNAFKVDLNLYHHASGDYRGRTGSVYIPQQLEGIVTGVFGLDNRPKRRSVYRNSPVSSNVPNTHNDHGAVPAGLFTAADLAERYNFPTDSFNGPLDGNGQTVAIIELGGGFIKSDLIAYFDFIGLPTPNVVAVSVDQIQNNPTAGSNSPDGEVMLDIEVVGGAAPNARQVIYFGRNSSKGFFNAISAAVMDKQRKPSVISISWGGPERDETEQMLNAMGNLFKKAALLGITICVASGDHGSIDIDPEDPLFTTNNGALNVDLPSCLAGALACGGTRIFENEEVVWNDNDGWAGGGGVSVRVPRPAYQNNTDIPVSPANGFRGKGVPDVSASATNYFVRVRGQFTASGGTSAVAPLWAGLIARLNQAMGKPVGFINPFLYSNSHLCRDITTGNNDITGSQPPHFAAQVGWDAATGLGVPDGTAILNAM
jgi:kumamolisin